MRDALRSVTSLLYGAVAIALWRVETDASWGLRPFRFLQTWSLETPYAAVAGVALTAWVIVDAASVERAPRIRDRMVAFCANTLAGGFGYVVGKDQVTSLYWHVLGRGWPRHPTIAMRVLGVAESVATLALTLALVTFVWAHVATRLEGGDDVTRRRRLLAAFGVAMLFVLPASILMETAVTGGDVIDAIVSGYPAFFTVVFVGYAARRIHAGHTRAKDVPTSHVDEQPIPSAP